MHDALSGAPEPTAHGEVLFWEDDIHSARPAGSAHRWTARAELLAHVAAAAERARESRAPCRQRLPDGSWIVAVPVPIGETVRVLVIGEPAQEFGTAGDPSAGVQLTDVLIGLVHELRSPLNSIVAASQMLSRMAELPSRAARWLASIDHGSRSLRRLATRLGDVVGGPDSGPAPAPAASIPTMLHNLEEYAGARLAAAGGTVQLHLDAEVPRRARFDVGRVESGLIALVDWLLGGADPTGLRVSVTSEGSVDGRSELVIELAAQHLPDTGERSRRTGHRAFDLWIGRQLIARAGGSSSFAGTAGQPPVVVRVPVLSADGPGDLPPEIRGGIRVLVADDEQENRSVLCSVLADLGAETTSAADGFEAVESFRRDPADLILMDLGMPRLDGLEAIRWIRASSGGEAVPVYVITARAVQETDRNAREAGATGVLYKPISLEQLGEVLARHARPALVDACHDLQPPEPDER